MSRKWTKKEDELLKKLYPNVVTNQIVKHFDRSLSGIQKRAYTLGLRKSLEFKQSGAKRLEESGKAHRIKKGHTPWNKDTKGLTGANSGSFKKGHRPANAVEIGTEVELFDGYIKVKIAGPKSWELKHRVVWQENNGAIPTDHVIRFQNGNRKDCRIENLYLTDKAGNMLRNTIHRYPDHIKKVIRRTAKLKRFINQMEAQENE